MSGEAYYLLLCAWHFSIKSDFNWIYTSQLSWKAMLQTWGFLSAVHFSWVLDLSSPTGVLLVAYGSMARLSMEVVNRLRERGIRIGLIRPISLWPFPYDVIKELANRVKFVFVVEMSEGQMLEDVKLAVGGKIPVHFYGRLGGGVPIPLEIIEKIESLLKNRI